MKKMAKNLAVVMAMAAMLVGCGKANSTDNASASNNTKVENTASDNKNSTEEKDETKDSTAKADEALAAAIANDFDLKDDEAKNTEYSYAPVELSKDGGKQVLVLLRGDAFSGSGGTTMALYSEKDGNYTKVQDWTLINSPVYVSKEESNGYKTLVVQAGGGGAKEEWKALEYNGKEYSNVNDSKSIDFDTKDALQTLFEDNASFFNVK